MPAAPYAIRQHDDFEPQPGLPERLPADEQLLWQGAPRWTAVFTHVFHGRKAALYFAVLLAWQVASALADGTPAVEAWRSAARVGTLYALALGLLALLAWFTARTTLYTLTSRRIAMRIGVVLTVTYNLPLRSIDAAHLHPCSAGVGDIALELKPGTRIAWLHLWPHARPWRIRQPQPMLRCLNGAEAVAAQLGQAWVLANARGGVPAAAALPAETAGREDVRVSSPTGPAHGASDTAGPRVAWMRG